jgi:hypothetical protein
MSHPLSADLELYACHDLHGWSGWRLARHVAKCSACSEQVTQLRQFWQAVDWAAPMPEPAWNRLAAEMQANIHLGLSAGECIAPRKRQAWIPLPMAAALASLLVIAAAGTYYHQSVGLPARAVAPVLETSGAGIQARDGNDVLEFVNRSSQAPIRTVSAGGEVRSRYVDGDSGDVTIVNVSAQ